MSKKLPAQVRVHIRDLIDESASEVQEAIKALNTAIGSGFHLEVAWEDVFRDLKGSFADEMDKLVPSIARHITIFVNRLQSVLEQDDKFQDTFLEEYPALRAVLSVVVHAGPKTNCKIANHRITILLPTTGEDGFRAAQASVGSDITNLFKESGEEGTSSHPAAREEPDEDPEWDTVNIAPAKTEPSRPNQDNRTPIKFEDSATIKPRPLPKLKALQRPEVLFNDLIPAYVTIKGDSQLMFIEGSHAPTITLIAEYFKNYARKDLMDAHQSPRFKVEEITSNFGSGTMSDCIRVDLWNRNREWRINVALFASFIEGVCGYEMVEGKIGSYMFKRTVPF